MSKIMITKQNNPEKAAGLFNNWDEAVVWSCLQSVMGGVYTPDEQCPKSAMATLGDFCFLAGEPDRELVTYKPEDCHQEFIIMVPQDDAWAKLIQECYKHRCKEIKRYAIKKEKDVFDREMLQRASASLPRGFTVRMIDEEIFNLCRMNDWSRDLVSQFKDYGMYEELGLGAAVLQNGIPVSGASSYARYRDGIEIEIDTREEFRRMGLAYVCGARLILECLERNLYPSWDAHNRGSVALAEKLGYHYDCEYRAFEVYGYGGSVK